MTIDPLPPNGSVLFEMLWSRLLVNASD